MRDGGQFSQFKKVTDADRGRGTGLGRRVVRITGRLCPRQHLRPALGAQLEQLRAQECKILREKVKSARTDAARQLAPPFHLQRGWKQASTGITRHL